MIEVLKKIAIDAMNSSGPVRLTEATVTSEPPNLEIRLRGDAKLTIPKELLVVSEHLTRHKRSIVLNGGTTSKLEFIDELKYGDKVMVIALQGGQKFYISDRLKTY